MAELRIEDDHLVLGLTGLERLEALHGDVRVPLSAVTAVDAIDRPVRSVRGWRIPGTSIPGVMAVGTFRGRHGRQFAVVHRRTRRGVRVRLTGAGFDELIVGVDAPERVIEAFAEARA